jgi:hypothetical protein
MVINDTANLQFNLIQTAGRLWIVQSDPKFVDETLPRILSELGIAPDIFIDTWLTIETDAGVILEPDDQPIQHLAFFSRDDARKYIRTWSGKIIAKLAPDDSETMADVGA